MEEPAAVVPPGPSRRPLTPRVLVGVAAVLLLGLSARDAVWRAGQTSGLKALLHETGLDRRQPELVSKLLAEPDPSRARLGVARALVHEAVDMSSFATLPPREAAEEAARVGERLELAERLATRALQERPAAWQAPLLLGAARYLSWSRRGDPRLFSERAAWEEPLLDAVAAGPKEEEALRLLAVTRLELWPTFDARERVAARRVLARAFEDPGTSALLLSAWLRIAGSTEEALAILPPRSETWAGAAQSFAAEKDWGAFVEIWRHQERLQRREVESMVREVGERLAGGDLREGRKLALQVIAAAPLDVEGAELVARVVAMMPPAAAGAEKGGAAWVQWAANRMVRGQAGLAPSVVSRLLGWAGELPPPRLAVSRLAAGDLAGAELLERKSEDTNVEAWAPYFLGKARFLIEATDLKGAQASLARVHRSWRKRPALLHAQLLLGERHGGDAVTLPRQELAAVAAEAWPGTEWQWSGDRAELEIELARPAAGLILKVDLAPPAGAVASLRVDDGPNELLVAVAGTELELRRDLAPGLHVVELLTITVGRVVPGDVRAQVR